jgi:hypothetical protein
VRTITATRYVEPLREGGSLPAIIEADDNRLYVIKFRGAGQGVRALIAELLAGEMLRALGLPVPEQVFIEFDAAIAHNEPDEEIQDLLHASVGLNIGLDFLTGAFAFDPLLTPPPAPEFASAVVWADAYLTNVDRTPRNPNILMVEGQPWLIDHGAALYFHHTWANYETRSRSRFPQIRDHVLLPFASLLHETNTDLSARITPTLIDSLVQHIPDNWLGGNAPFASPADERAAYATYLRMRLEAPRDFVEEAIDAHTQRV